MTDEECEALLDVIAWDVRGARADARVWRDLDSAESGIPLLIPRRLLGHPVSVSDSA